MPRAESVGGPHGAKGGAEGAETREARLECRGSIPEVATAATTPGRCARGPGAHCPSAVQKPTNTWVDRRYPSTRFTTTPVVKA